MHNYLRKHDDFVCSLLKKRIKYDIINITEMERGASIMRKRSFEKIIGIILTLALLVGMSALGGTVASAADIITEITVLDVTRSYKSAQELLDLCNQYRREKGKSEWVFDKDSLESAMLRAAEISVYASKTCPNGKDGLSYVTNATDAGQIIGYDIVNVKNFITDAKSKSESNGILLDSGFKSVGIGVIIGKGNKKFACILASNKTPTTVASSVLTQSNITIDQDIKIKTSLLNNNVYSFYPTNTPTPISVGSGVIARFYATNTGYPSYSAVIGTKNVSVSLSNKGAFSYSDGRINAIGPGVCTVSMYLKDAASIGVSFQLEGIAKQFSACSFAAIPDQAYTGKAITPDVTITDSSGQRLVKGTDYNLTYSNNVNVGTASVTITGIGSYVGQKKEMSFNIVNGAGTAALEVSLTATLTNFSIGQSTSITAHATGGTTPYKYTFSCAPYGTSTWTTIVSNSSSPTCNYSPTTAGKFAFRATVVDAKGSSAFRSAVLTVSEQLSLKVKLSSSSITAGNSITVTPVYSGGASPYQFAYYVQKPNSSSWTTIKDYSSSTSVTYKPDTVGAYKIRIKCKTASDYVGQADATLNATGSTLENKSTVSTNNITLGQSVTVQGLASGGTAPYQYAFYYKLSTASKWTTAQSYGTTSKVSIKPAHSGTYNIRMNVKDNGNVVVKKDVNITVKPKLVNSASVTPTTIYLGNTVKVTCNASGGSGGYQYAVYYKLSTVKKWTKARDYATGTSITVKPAHSGDYDIRVKVKDSNQKIVNKDLKVTVKPALKNTSSLTPATIVLGQTVKVTCTAIAGSGGYQYAVYYKLSTASKWTKGRDYGTGTTVTVKPAHSGTYTIRVKVKDSVGKVVNKDLKVTVKPAIKNISTISATSIKKGATVTVNCKAEAGSGSYQYAVYYKKDSSSSWSTASSFSSTASVKVTPKYASGYTIRTKVKDTVTGKVVSKDIKLTVNA